MFVFIITCTVLIYWLLSIFFENSSKLLKVLKKIIKLQSVNFCHNKSRKIANSWWNKYFIALVWYMWAHVSDLFGHLQYTKCKYVQCTIKNIIWIYLLCWPTGIPYIPGWRIRKQFFLIKPTDPSKKDVRNILTWVM